VCVLVVVGVGVRGEGYIILSFFLFAKGSAGAIWYGEAGGWKSMVTVDGRHPEAFPIDE